MELWRKGWEITVGEADVASMPIYVNSLVSELSASDWSEELKDDDVPQAADITATTCFFLAVGHG